LKMCDQLVDSHDVKGDRRVSGKCDRGHSQINITVRLCFTSIWLFFSDILSITIVGFSVNQWRKC